MLPISLKSIYNQGAWDNFWRHKNFPKRHFGAKAPLLATLLVIVLLFINSSELSAVISSDEFTKSEIVLIISTIPLFHWNNHTKKMLESLNLLGPWTKVITNFEFSLLYTQQLPYFSYLKNMILNTRSTI